MHFVMPLHFYFKNYAKKCASILYDNDVFFIIFNQCHVVEITILYKSGFTSFI